MYTDKCFITKDTAYCLLDGTGDIRDTASDIEGIIHARSNHGWGEVHRCKFDGKTLKIGRRINLV